MTCEVCGCDGGIKRACGEVLCQECYREHLIQDRSVGIERCWVCYDEEVMADAEAWADFRANL